MELVRKLKARAAEKNPVRVGIVGCGQMGSGLAHAISNVGGMRVSAIADVQTERAIETLEHLGVCRDEILLTDKQGKAEDALRAGRAVVTGHFRLMAQLEGLEAIVDATGVPDVGAELAYRCIMNRKPIILLNVETDVTVGVHLSRLARANRTVYTAASGDEPGVCTMLYEQAVLMGFEVVCLGKGKNNPINYDANPEICAAEAERKGMNPKMLAAFQDGTKTMVEMASVANATGMTVDVPGMHGPKVELADLVRTFVPKADGGIFANRGVVDFSTGKIAPGVFAIVYSDNPRIRKDMKFITGAEGPYYLHFRPYHLCDIETPISIAEAVLLGEVTCAADTMHAEVATIAKRDLKPGEKLGSIGGPDFFGRIYPYAQARQAKALPLGLTGGATVTQPVVKGSLLTYENCRPDSTTFIYGMRMMQDRMLDGERA